MNKTKHSQRLPEISVAPMMDWTDRHCRYFHRLLAPNIRLYTEMVTTGALIHGDRDRHLRFNPEEHPLALQLGGSEPDDLAACARLGADFGYDELNLNCGCPSERVQKGSFGACLMAEPDTVARCVAAMVRAVDIPVTVKCRIGIDDADPELFLRAFIKPVAEAGCKTFIIHARKAWLKGLSPKENREIPPLDYDLPAAIRAEYPHLRIILNGGIQTIGEVNGLLAPPPRYDGLMIGRAAYHTPELLQEIERTVFGTADLMRPEDAVLAMIPYIERQQREYGTPINTITRHMIGLFGGRRGARGWRQTLSTLPHTEGASAETVLKTALAALSI